MSVRVAIVGCGGVSRSHIAGFKKIEDVSLVAMCDLQEDRAKAHAQDHGGEPFTSVEEMLAKAGPDCVDVCTREAEHCEPVIQCLEAAVPTMVEKPIYSATQQFNVQPSDVPVAQKMVKAAQDNATHLQMNYNYRFSPYAIRLHEMIQSGEMGDPVYVNATCHLACWSHTIDLIRFFNGDVTEMAARMTGPEDRKHRAAAFRFANGSIGTLVGMTETGWQHDLLRIEYVGTACKAVMRDIAGGLYLYPRDRREETIYKTPHDGPRSEFQLTFDGSMRAFCDTVRDGTRTHAATGLDGLRELEIDAGYVVASDMNEWLNLREQWGEP